MHTGKQKQMNASYQASLVNRHIRRFTGNLLNFLYLHLWLNFTSPKRARCSNLPAKKKRKKKRMRRLEWPFCERYDSYNVIYMG